LWEEYREQHPDGYCYSRFCKLRPLSNRTDNRERSCAVLRALVQTRGWRAMMKRCSGSSHEGQGEGVTAVIASLAEMCQALKQERDSTLAFR
jgi:hypothetical protein